MQPIEIFSALSGPRTDPAVFLSPIEFLRGEHERQRWFCEQLATLADDIWQPGREKLALTLLDFANIDIANSIEDECDLLAPALFRCCVAEAGPREVVFDMVRRHRSVAALAASTIDGLDRLASGEMPVVPTHFILAALGLVELLQANLDWGDTVLLPFAASRLSVAEERGLGSAMAQRHVDPSPN